MKTFIRLLLECKAQVFGIWFIAFALGIVAKSTFTIFELALVTFLFAVLTVALVILWYRIK